MVKYSVSRSVRSVRNTLDILCKVRREDLCEGHICLSVRLNHLKTLCEVSIEGYREVLGNSSFYGRFVHSKS